MNYGRRVVITGSGVITPIGIGTSVFWENLCAGKSGAAPITHVDTEGLASKICAPIKNFNPLDHFDKKEVRKNEHFSMFAMVAAREALKSSGLEITDELSTRAGTIIGCGIGGLESIEQQHSVLLEKSAKRISPFLIPKIITNIAAGMVAIDLHLKGPNSCIVTACASASHSIGEAFHTVKRGDADVMFTGGTESAMTKLGLAGFSNMHALTTRNDDPERASRPFDKERDGFLMGEGAGILVLEEYEHAKKRGADILAEVVGYGATCDAFHITAPASDGDGGSRAMRAAVENAELPLEAVQYVNAHGTSTPLNDKLEVLAIKNTFGAHAEKMAVSSNKSMIGHLLGAAGGVETIATALSLKQGVLPPTINYENPDPECDMDVVPNEAREADIQVAISNSLGFGGHNATLCLKKFEG